MLSDNIVMLRHINGYSQEEVSEKIGISRQAYAKWEKGETIPDVERCLRLAELYGTTVDDLLKSEYKIGNTTLPPEPKGKHVFGTSKINNRGELLIPKRAREIFNIKPDDLLVILGDEAEGIAIVKADSFEKNINQLLKKMKNQIQE